MSNNENFDPAAPASEDPLEALLDETTEEEFGLPEFRNHFSADNTPVVLRDWTAKEFASVYVRFKPHLERHARRYLNNQTQVEEVVQDAFLYLMTALPELDSELGVLRFLKWKTRLLAIDLIRVNSRVAFDPIENEDLVSLEPEISKGLERADDAAIVSMALAKLNPRHREVLIASLYQEKSTEDISGELGLSDNATRQLIFRARAAFKKALVGEAETAGLRISEILSIAARKARSEVATIVSSASAIALLVGAVFMFNSFGQDATLNAGPGTTQSQGLATQEATEGLATQEATEPEVPVVDQPAVPESDASAPAQPGSPSETEVTAPAQQPSQAGSSAVAGPAAPSEDETDQAATIPSEEAYALEFGRASLASIQLVETAAPSQVSSIDPVRIYMIDSEGRSISFLFDLNAEDIFTDVKVQISVDGVRFTTLTLQQVSVTADFENGRFVFESQLGLLVDRDRNLLENDAVNDATVRIQLDTDEDLTRINMYEVSYHLEAFAARTS